MRGRVDLAMAWAVFMRNATEYRHTWRTNLLPNFFEPIVYLAGMGLGLGYYLSDGIAGGDYLAYIAPGLCMVAAMNGASLEATYNMFVKMRFTRLYDAYVCTPAQPQDIIAGELLWAMARASIYGVAFLCVMAVLRALGHPTITSPAVMLMPAALALVGVTFALIGQLFTTLIRHMDLYSYYYTLGITPLVLFSGVFYPVARFPHGEAVAWCTPLFHGVRLGRGLCQGPLEVTHAISAGWLLGVSLLLGRAVPVLMRRCMLT